MNNCILYIYSTEERIRYVKEHKKILENIEYYFVYNKSSNPLIEPFLKFDDEEVYENISLKTYNCFNHFIGTNKEFFIKINDDCVLDVEKLQSNFNYFKNFDVIGGFVKNDYNNCSSYDKFKARYIHSFKFKDKKVSPKLIHDIPYPEGSFYILSRFAVEKILSKFKKSDFKQDIDRFFGEDMTVGSFLNHFKQELKFLDIKIDIDLVMDVTRDFISAHPIKSIFMEKYFRLNNKARIEFLKNINYSNEYMEKENFLKKMFYEYSKQS